MKVLLLVALCLAAASAAPARLLDGLPPAERAAARSMLESALVQLEGHYRSLGFVPTREDRWPGVVERLRAGRREHWAEWKRELERSPEVLGQVPEACLVLGASSSVQVASLIEGTARARPTRQSAHVVWLEDAQRVLLGESDELPAELAFGYPRVGPGWFFFMRTTLEQAGAPTVADRLAAYQRLKTHWFARQLAVYQALAEAVRSPWF